MSISFFIFFLFFFMKAACSMDAQFESCAPQTCSSNGIPIKYPFSFPSQSNCGYPGFNIACRNTTTTLLLKSPTTLNFTVKAINYTSQTITVAMDADQMGGTKTCPLPRRNVTLSTITTTANSSFSLALSSNRNATFYYRCTTPPPTAGGYISSFDFTANVVPSCSNATSGLYSYAFLDDSFMASGVEFSCEQALRIPVLTSAGGAAAFPAAWSAGFDLRWSVSGDSRDCISCGASGGRCGFDTRSSSFVCFCQDGPRRTGNCSISSPALSDKLMNSRTKKKIIAGVSAGVSITFVTLVVVLLMCRIHFHKQRRLMSGGHRVEEFLKDYKCLVPKRYSYHEVKRITKQFKHKLGQGGYGSVYKGELPNRVPVAIKVIDKASSNGEAFINEVATIGRIHHVNVVHLLGFCSEGRKQALIYEFMPNESLEKFISSTEVGQSINLSWEKLYDIALGVARGIEYLHQGCDQRILHFDIKPHNILLDHNFVPKISDFGLAKLCCKEQSIVSMTAARGTIGYIAPEVFFRNFGVVSYKSDIYSFGMLLLEMVGRRKYIAITADDSNEIYFPEWVYNHLAQGELEIEASFEKKERIARQLAIVALWCIQWDPANRPCIKKVVQMLEDDTESLEIPPKPFIASSQRAL